MRRRIGTRLAGFAPVVSLALAAPAWGQGLSHLWSQGFGGSAADFGRAVAVDGAGNVLLTGRFDNTVDFGGGPITGGSIDVFVAKLDGAGNHVWSQGFGGFGTQIGNGIAVDAANNVLVIGHFSHTLDFGGGPITSAGSADIFVAKFDSTGAHLWSHGFGDFDLDLGRGIAADPAGNVLVSGSFDSTVDFGGGPITSAGESDIFVVKLDPGGAHLWSHGFGNEQGSSASGITADGAGNVYLSGGFLGAVDFGGGPIGGIGVTSFVAKFDGTGNHLWSQGGVGGQVAVDGSGNVVVSGFSAGVHIAKLEPGGTLLWSQVFENSNAGADVAVDGADNVLLAGHFLDTIDFGGGPIMSPGVQFDIFAAKFDSDGNHLWSQGFGATSGQGQGVAVGDAGNVVMTGRFSGTVDFGGGPITSAGLDIFVAKFGELIDASVDIEPGDCPNEFKPRLGNSGHKIDIALVGTADLDVTEVDFSTILLSRADGIGGAVLPERVRVKDRATPFDGDLCGCHDRKKDGIRDLRMRFFAVEMTFEMELDLLAEGESLELMVTGELFDGTPFVASDCIVIDDPPGRDDDSDSDSDSSDDDSSDDSESDS